MTRGNGGSPMMIATAFDFMDHMRDPEFRAELAAGLASRDGRRCHQ